MKRFSGFITGVLVTLLVAGLASPALAALTAKTIEVYTGVTLYLDDVKFTPKDANGNPVEVLLYNGTTYLPVRAIGEAYGKAIAWDDATKSAYIGYHAGAEKEPAMADGVYDVYLSQKINSDGSVTVEPVEYVGLTQAEVDALVRGKSVLDFSEYTYEDPVTVRSLDYSADGKNLYVNHSELWFWWSEIDQLWQLLDDDSAAITRPSGKSIDLPVAEKAVLEDYSMGYLRSFSTAKELIENSGSYNMLTSITVKNGEIIHAEIYFHP